MVSFLSPQLRVAGSALNQLSGELSGIAIVNGVVRSVCSCDKVLRIENDIVSVLDVLQSHWIYVMNEQPVVDLVAWYAQITTVVSDNDFVSKTMPFSGPVELLVDPSIEAKCRFADLTPQDEVLEPIFEGVEAFQFRITPNPRSHRLSPQDHARRKLA